MQLTLVSRVLEVSHDFTDGQIYQKMVYNDKEFVTYAVTC